MTIETIMLAVLSAIVYAVVAYAKTQKEEFDALKFSATIIVGAIVGFAFAITDTPIAQASIETQLVAYVGVIVIVENVLKAVYRKSIGSK